MKKRITSILLTGLLVGIAVFSTAVPANAANYTYTDTGVFSNGNPTQNDATAASTSFDVSAHVEGGADIVYSVKIEWGAMQFEYDYGSIWNPTTHKYEAGNSGLKTPGGWVQSHLDGSNDKITVTNDSNYPIAATFSYADTNNALNPNNTTSDPVTGIFDVDETSLKALVTLNKTSSLTSDKTNPTRYLDMCTEGLDAGDTYYAYNGTVGKTGGYVQNMYFSLVGEPDPGLNMAQGSYANIGTITVDIAPVASGSVSTATK